MSVSRSRLTGVLSLAEILGMAGFATFPALLSTFLDEWGLTNLPPDSGLASDAP